MHLSKDEIAASLVVDSIGRDHFTSALRVADALNLRLDDGDGG
jgi:hypothetical protein